MPQVFDNMVPGGGFEPPTRGFSIRAKSEENQAGCVSKSPQTDRERNENVSSADLNSAKENPGALAGATEVDLEGFWSLFDHNLIRQAQASRIIDAVLSCDPEDRVLFLETILDQIRPGWPKSFNIDVMEEAGWWADTASTPERKAYMLACYRRLSRTDKESFLTYITGRAAA